MSPLSSCKCCPRECGVNRLAGETGFCRTPAEIRVSHAGLHFGEEPPISGTKGSGTVFFWGCNLRCVFCQNHQISQGKWAAEGTGASSSAPGGREPLSTDDLAAEMLRLQSGGAHNINFVSPSHMVHQMADAIERSRLLGLSIPIVYNSNGYDSVESLDMIRGLVDIYLPDIKYMKNEIGARLSGVADYADVAPAAIEEMLDQVGPLEVDQDGVAVRGLLVRHLVLPGGLENSRECLRFLAELDPGMAVSLMSQYSPRHNASRHPDIDRPLTAEEYEEILDFALQCGLENAFVQEVESQAHYLPDFDRIRPFDPVPPGSAS